MGIFDAMGSARRQYANNYFRPGRYICRIDECATFEMTGKGPAFKATMTVLHVIDDPKGDGLRVGEQVTWLQMQNPFPSTFLARVKQLVGIATGASDEEIGKNEMEAICDPNTQALAGYCVEAECRMVPKKDQPAGTTVPVMTAKTSFKRSVTNEEVGKLLSPEQVKKLYPKGIPADPS